jgi:hypothetical protein
MSKMFAPERLWQLRNEIPVAWLIRHLRWPHKHREGRFCFVCPACGETLTAVNPRTNLGRCFRCERNFNPIDLTMTIRECEFVEAVHYLESVHKLASSAP